jgi:hypothetical protein
MAILKQSVNLSKPVMYRCTEDNPRVVPYLDAERCFD